LQQLLEKSAQDLIRQGANEKDILSQYEVILDQFKHLDLDMWLQNTVSMQRAYVLQDSGNHAGAIEEVRHCLARGAYSAEDFTGLAFVYADVLADSGSAGEALLELTSALRALPDQELGCKINLLKVCCRICVERKASPPREIVEIAQSLTQSFDCAPAPSAESDSSGRLHELEALITTLTNYAGSGTRPN